MAFLAAFLSVFPLAYLLGHLLAPGYRPAFLPLERFLRRHHSPLVLAVVAGLLAGNLAAFLVDFLNVKVWGFSELEFKHSQALTWSLQLAFVRAGLVEEIAKCLFAWLFMHLFCGRKGGYYRSAPIIAAATGLGFAFLENSGYFATFGAQGRLGLFFSRFFFAATAHMLFGLLFGLWMASRIHLPEPVRFLSGLFWVVLGHRIYDFFAVAQAPFAALLVFLTLSLLGYATLQMYAEFTRGQRRRSPWKKVRGRALYKEEAVLRDPYWSRRPLAGAIKTWPLPFLDESTRSALMIAEFSGPLGGEQARMAELWQGRLERFRPDYWDASIFAATKSSQASYEGLRRYGIDLLNMQPLRVASYEQRDGMRYVSIGLLPVCGVELAILLPGAFPAIRLFFLAIAAGTLHLPGRFEYTPLPSLLAGDPMDWVGGFVRVPLTDDLLRMATDRSAVGLDEILFYSRPEGETIMSRGWPAFLELQKEAGIPWGNDFSRRLPAL